MNTLKKLLIFSAVTISVAVVGMFIGSATYSHPPVSISPNLQVRMMDPIFPANFADNRILVGASQNVFVGKVMSDMGQKQNAWGPATQFAVRVIYNIKGNLKGIVTVDQDGGYVNGVLYEMENIDVTGPAKDGPSTYFLQPGSTYVIASRYDSPSNSYNLAPLPVAAQLVSADNGLTDADLYSMAEKNQRTQALEAAYPHEILLQADIVNGYTMNSYESLHSNQDAATSTQTTSTSSTSQ